ncbi:MAG: hypothetical protein ACYTKD_22985 [Planctomycetota bacterium]|jgi:hypothetical protein
MAMVKMIFATLVLKGRHAADPPDYRPDALLLGLEALDLLPEILLDLTIVTVINVHPQLLLS